MGKILVINGVNLGMLGIREPELYGNQTYSDLEKFIKFWGKQYGLKVTVFQSDKEGEICQLIHGAYWKGYDGIIINAGAYTHTSIAILDALKAAGKPTVEVHLTDINEREEFRKFSYISLYAQHVIVGKGFDGYREALAYFAQSAQVGE